VSDYYGDTRVVTPRAAGWLSFAAALLVVSGIFKIFDALWAFKFDDDVSEEVQTVLFENDLESWGWVWLVVGVVLVLAGSGSSPPVWPRSPSCPGSTTSRSGPYSASRWRYWSSTHSRRTAAPASQGRLRVPDTGSPTLSRSPSVSGYSSARRSTC
jgi:hypothetical protein